MLNKAMLIGNVGTDPETRKLENGTGVTSFTLATNKKFKNQQGEKQDITTWHRIVLWRNLSDIAEKYVNKGDKLYIEGEIINRSYDAEDGTKRYITEIVASDLKMLGNKKDSDSKTVPSGSEIYGTPKPKEQEKINLTEELDDDLPF